jgi:hypothetical protein
VAYAIYNSDLPPKAPPHESDKPVKRELPIPDRD